MKKYSLLLLLLLLSLSCAEPVKEAFNQNQSYGNTTRNTRISDEKIDGSPTYEVIFTLEKPVDCMTINIESAYLQKTFPPPPPPPPPVQKIPKTTFFIVEKKLNMPQFKINAAYTPIGRNFNSDWELYSPVKVCGNSTDPLSIINVSEYRIRFSAFEKAELYYIVTITCESKIIFIENTPDLKK